MSSHEIEDLITPIMALSCDRLSDVPIISGSSDSNSATESQTFISNNGIQTMDSSQNNIVEPLQCLSKGNQITQNTEAKFMEESNVGSSCNKADFGEINPFIEEGLQEGTRKVNIKERTADDRGHEKSDVRTASSFTASCVCTSLVPPVSHINLSNIDDETGVGCIQSAENNLNISARDPPRIVLSQKIETNQFLDETNQCLDETNQCLDETNQCCEHTSHINNETHNLMPDVTDSNENFNDTTKCVHEACALMVKNVNTDDFLLSTHYEGKIDSETVSPTIASTHDIFIEKNTDTQSSVSSNDLGSNIPPDVLSMPRSISFYQQYSSNTSSEDSFNCQADVYRRVKLYEVDLSSGLWVDKGTGHVYLFRFNNTRRIVVVDELDTTGNTLFVDSNISLNSDYSHQKDTIMTWLEEGSGEHYRALSFQFQSGCVALWLYVREHVDDTTTITGDADEMNSQTDYEGEVLEVPTKENLDRIVFIIENSLVAGGEQLFVDICKKSFWRILFQTLDTCIEQDDVYSSRMIAAIATKTVVQWHGRFELFQMLFSDEFFLHFLRACEYDDELMNESVVLNHVEYFTKRVQFHQVIDNLSHAANIHLIYRLTYVRDVCVVRHLDEQAMARMNQMVLTATLEVIRDINKDNGALMSYLKKQISENIFAGFLLRDILFALKHMPNPLSTERTTLLTSIADLNILKDIMDYIGGLNNGTKSWEELHRNSVKKSEQWYDKLKERLNSYPPGKFHVPDVLDTDRTPYMSSASIGVEILHLLTEVSLISLKSQFLENKSVRAEYWTILCNMLAISTDEGVQTQIKDIFIRVLSIRDLPPSLYGLAPGFTFPSYTSLLQDRADVLAVVYEEGVFDQLLEILKRPPGLEHETDETICGLRVAKTQVIDIFSFFVLQHRYEFQHRINSCNLFYVLFKSSFVPVFDKILTTATIRFIKVCIFGSSGTLSNMKSSENEATVQLENCLSQSTVLKPVLWILKHKVCVYRTRGGGCLIESLCLDLLQTIVHSHFVYSLMELLEADQDCYSWLNHLNRHALEVSNNPLYQFILDRFQHHCKMQSRKRTISVSLQSTKQKRRRRDKKKGHQSNRSASEEAPGKTGNLADAFRNDMGLFSENNGAEAIGGENIILPGSMKKESVSLMEAEDWFAEEKKSCMIPEDINEKSDEKKKNWRFRR